MKKICSKCHKEKELYEFRKTNKYKGGYCSFCKECDINRKKEWVKSGDKRLQDFIVTHRTKVCNCCKLIKQVSDFSNNKHTASGLDAKCKVCTQKRDKILREKNIDIKIDGVKICKKCNIEKDINNFSKSKKHKDGIKNTCKICNKDYYNIFYKNKRNAYLSKRRKIDPLFRLITSIRNAIKKSINNGKYSKKKHTEQILGCSFKQLKLHIESKWEPWMNWDNYGKFNGQPKYGWDIDHKKPLSLATTEVEIIELNHFLNLQPLCSYVNRCVKKDKPDFKTH